MPMIRRLLTLAAALVAAPAAAQSLPTEIPAKFTPASDSWDYVKRDLMVPMRDGVKLRTIILIPKGAKGAPILLTRTPYDCFLPLMALVHPHPALKVAVPMNPMVDGWMGDDWFHNGAFRQQGIDYIYEQEATTKNDEKWWTGHYDDYDEYLLAGNVGEI